MLPRGSSLAHHSQSLEHKGKTLLLQRKVFNQDVPSSILIFNMLDLSRLMKNLNDQRGKKKGKKKKAVSSE